MCFLFSRETERDLAQFYKISPTVDSYNGKKHKDANKTLDYITIGDRLRIDGWSVNCSHLNDVDIGFIGSILSLYVINAAE